MSTPPIGARGAQVARPLNTGSTTPGSSQILKMTPAAQALIVEKMRPLEELEYHQKRLEELQHQSATHYASAKVHGARADQLTTEIEGHKANIADNEREIEKRLASADKARIEAAKARIEADKARAEQERLRAELAALDDDTDDDDDTEEEDVQRSPQIRAAGVANQLLLEGSRK